METEATNDPREGDPRTAQRIDPKSGRSDDPRVDPAAGRGEAPPRQPEKAVETG